MYLFNGDCVDIELSVTKASSLRKLLIDTKESVYESIQSHYITFWKYQYWGIEWKLVLFNLFKTFKNKLLLIIVQFQCKLLESIIINSIHAVFILQYKCNYCMKGWIILFYLIFKISTCIYLHFYCLLFTSE